jgi:hypothetical protein
MILIAIAKEKRQGLDKCAANNEVGAVIISGWCQIINK